MYAEAKTLVGKAIRSEMKQWWVHGHGAWKIAGSWALPGTIQRLWNLAISLTHCSNLIVNSISAYQLAHSVLSHIRSELLWRQGDIYDICIIYIIYMPSTSLACQPGPKIHSLQNGRRALSACAYFKPNCFCYFSGGNCFVLLLLSLSTVPVVGGSAVQHDATMAFSGVPGSRGCNEGARPLATFLVDLFVRVTFETFWDICV